MIRHHSQTAPIRVLCVDGDSYLTDLLRYALGRDGFTVTVAGTGAEALCSAQTDPPDVVLLDLGLLDVDGFALCDRLCRELRLPVILLTANRLEADMVTGLRSLHNVPARRGTGSCDSPAPPLLPCPWCRLPMETIDDGRGGCAICRGQV